MHIWDVDAASIRDCRPLVPVSGLSAGLLDDVCLTMRTWLKRQIAELTELRSHPEPDESLFEDCASVVREAANRAAKVGMLDHYKRHKGVKACTPADAKAVLESILAATEPEPEFFTPPQAAKLLKINPDKVRAWISSGRLPAIDISTTSRPRWRIKRGDVNDLRRTTAPPTRRVTRKTDPDVTEYY